MQHEEDTLLKQLAGGQHKLLHRHNDNLVEVLDVVLNLGLHVMEQASLEAWSQRGQGMHVHFTTDQLTFQLPGPS